MRNGTFELLSSRVESMRTIVHWAKNIKNGVVKVYIVVMRLLFVLLSLIGLLLAARVVLAQATGNLSDLIKTDSYYVDLGISVIGVMLAFGIVAVHEEITKEHPTNAELQEQIGTLQAGIDKLSLELKSQQKPILKEPHTNNHNQTSKKKKVKHKK